MWCLHITYGSNLRCSTSIPAASKCAWKSSVRMVQVLGPPLHSRGTPSRSALLPALEQSSFDHCSNMGSKLEKSRSLSLSPSLSHSVSLTLTCIICYHVIVFHEIYCQGNSTCLGMLLHQHKYIKITSNWSSKND